MISFQISKIVVLCSFLVISLNFSCTVEDYVNFLQNFNKLEPNDPYQFQIRLDIYCENKFFIQQSNKNDSLDYKLKEYYYMDLSDDEIQEIFHIPDELSQTTSNTNNQQQTFNGKVGTNTPPISLNYSASGTVTSPKNQGKCNCGWAFAMTSLYEAYILMQNGPYYDLAQQYVFRCTTNFTENIDLKPFKSNCTSGYALYAGQLIKNYGVPQQIAYPYTQQFYNSSFNDSLPQSQSNICNETYTKMYKNGAFLTIFSLNTYITADHLKQLLMNGPVSAYIYAQPGFLAYSSGIYKCNTSNDISFGKLNHVINIIGYDQNNNWLIKNSFGPSWGTFGFGILNNITNCGVMAYIYQYTANTSSPNYPNVYDHIITGNYINGYLKSQKLLQAIRIFVVLTLSLLAFF